MKVVVSSAGKDLNAQVDPRFGRCAYFVIVDTEDMGFVCYDNDSNALSSGTGIQAASFVISKGAEVVLTGNCGPKAIATFTAAGVTVYAGQTGTVGETIGRFMTGGLMSSTQPTVPEKAGVSAAFEAGASPTRGLGRCQGGSGRGMGMGGNCRGKGTGIGPGRGTGVPNSGGRIKSADSREETLAALNNQAEDLRRLMEAIQARIDSIE